MDGLGKKKGALVELNSLLLGEVDTSFKVISGDISKLKGKIKYIITIDADTKLPIDSAKKLIGAISHPLNQAKVDEEKSIVVEGYGIIQPRILVDIERAINPFLQGYLQVMEEWISMAMQYLIYTRIYLEKEYLMVREYMI